MCEICLPVPHDGVAVVPRSFLLCMCRYGYRNVKRLPPPPPCAARQLFCEYSRETDTCSLSLAKSLSELRVLAAFKGTWNTTVSRMRLNHCRNCVFSCFEEYLEYLCIYESRLTLFHAITSPCHYCSDKLINTLQHKIIRM